MVRICARFARGTPLEHIAELAQAHGACPELALRENILPGLSADNRRRPGMAWLGWPCLPPFEKHPRTLRDSQHAQATVLLGKQLSPSGRAALRRRGIRLVLALDSSS